MARGAWRGHFFGVEMQKLGTQRTPHGYKTRGTARWAGGTTTTVIGATTATATHPGATTGVKPPPRIAPAVGAAASASSVAGETAREAEEGEIGRGRGSVSARGAETTPAVETPAGVGEPAAAGETAARGITATVGAVTGTATGGAMTAAETTTARRCLRLRRRRQRCDLTRKSMKTKTTSPTKRSLRRTRHPNLRLLQAHHTRTRCT